MNLVNGLYWHPKIMRAVHLLKGRASHNDVFTLYVLGLAYSHQHLTDGFLPQAFVENLWKTGQNGVSREQVGSKSGATKKQVRSNPGLTIAEVLSKKTVRLWHPRPGGWEIHDYLKHNPTASAVRDKREKARLRQQAWREGKAGL